MDRFEEVLRLEEIGDTVERLVVDQYSAEQCLLGLDIVRRRARDVGSDGACFACRLRIEYCHGRGEGESRAYGRFAANGRNTARGSDNQFTRHRGSLNDRRTRPGSATVALNHERVVR